MNLLRTIIERLNQRIEVANIFDKQFNLCELNANGNDKAWVHYIGNGQAEVVTNFDAKNGTLFWAKRSKVTVNKTDAYKMSGCKQLYITSFPLTAYAIVKKSHLPCDSEDAQDWLASRIYKLASGTDPLFKQSIGVINYEVVPTGYINEIKTLTANYEWACVSVDMDIQVITSSEDGCYDTCATGDIPLPDLQPCTPCLTEVAVDGVTITGNGTEADPLVAIGGGGGVGTLQQVTNLGNSTTNDIDFIASAGLTFDNGAFFRKGTTDAGNGGAKGTAQICSISYELKWEAGRLYYMEQDGFTIRDVTHNFTFVPQPTDDSSKGFIVGSRWSLDDGTVYLCSDATIGAAVWAVVSVGGVTSVTATSPIFSSGGATPDISIQPANLFDDGYLTSADFTSFSNKFDVPTGTSADYLDGTGTPTPFPTIPSGTVTSVDLTMPAAFSVTGNPVTTSGTLAVAAAGLSTQYIRGDGQLANFPTSSGGGASVSYYLNGSVAQGTLGGVAFKQMSGTPVIGAGTDFSINADGYIQSFITDASVPNQLAIPAGNWNFEMYFSANNAGSSPRFYIDIFKLSAGTLSLIASSSANPEFITNGAVIDLYTTAVAMPSTVLLAADRLAIRVYVIHSSKTITLHTEDNHLCQVITTFSTGLTALNGLTDQVQLLAVGTSGTDFAINSTGSTHTFNLPTASAANRGALSSADWSTFNGKQATITPAALTKTDDTNVTLTLGGAPSTSLLAATSLTLGWTGTLADSRIASAATWNAKQAALVSGTNIKTINNSSILGSGNLATPFELVIAASDEGTALTAGTAKITFRMPRAVTLTAVRASLTTAQASGSIFTVDINESGTSILSTKLTIDNTETTSATAATPSVISDTALADDAEMTIDIDQIGNGTAKGLKVMLIGTYV